MALSLNPSIHFSLCLTHMAGFLHVHTSSVTTKVTPREGLARPQARRLREWRGGLMAVVVAGLALSLRHLPFERPFFFFPSFTSSLYLFPLLNLASGHSPPQKAGGAGERGTFILPSSFTSIYPDPLSPPDKMCAPNKRCDSRGGRFVSALTLITLTIPKSRPYFMSVPLHARANAPTLLFSLVFLCLFTRSRKKAGARVSYQVVLEKPNREYGQKYLKVHEMQLWLRSQ